MAINARQEEVFNWLDTGLNGGVTGFDLINRGLSYKTVAAKYANELQLDEASNVDVVVSSLSEDSPKDTVNPIVGNSVGIPYKLYPLKLDSNGNAVKDSQGFFQFTGSPVVFDLTIEERDLIEGLITVRTEAIAKNALSALNKSNNDTDVSLLDQLVDINQLKFEQSQEIVADSNGDLAAAVVRLKGVIETELSLENALVTASDTISTNDCTFVVDKTDIAADSTETSTFTVQLRNAVGEIIRTSGVAIEIATDSVNTTLSATTITTGVDGSATATLTGDTAETANVSVTTVDGNSFVGSAIEITLS